MENVNIKDNPYYGKIAEIGEVFKAGRAAGEWRDYQQCIDMLEKQIGSIGTDVQRAEFVKWAQNQPGGILG